MSNIESLYEWITNRYQEYLDGSITEETYLKDLEFYKVKLAESEADIANFVQSEDIERTLEEKIDPSKVRSTSIAGLRKKLLDEMKK